MKQYTGKYSDLIASSLDISNMLWPGPQKFKYIKEKFIMK